MANLKKWRQIGGSGNFVKWETNEQTIEGIWHGQHEGKYGPNGTVKTKDGEVRFPLHTGLLNQVEDLPEGSEVKIVYKGKHVNKNTGREFKAFDVFVADPEGGEDNAPF